MIDYNEELTKGNKILRDTLEFYKKNNIPVHIEKENGFFHNGAILEIGNDLVIIDDRMKGATLIHFLEIKVLEKFREKGVQE